MNITQQRTIASSSEQQEIAGLYNTREEIDLETTSQLQDVARAMVAPDKGILAADESGGTIKNRFDTIGLPSTEENRRAYRHMLFTTEGMEEFISGIILYDETLRQKALDEAETPFPKLLADRGILSGIKVDTGAHDLAGFPGEKVTEGLDGMRDRLIEYRALGAAFAKWRTVITVGQGIPTDVCIDANAHALARYASLCQEVGIVPIVEPEVLMDGDHTHLPVRRDYKGCASARFRSAPGVRSSAGRDRPETQHGHIRLALSGAGLRRRSRSTHGEQLPAQRTARSTWYRFSLRRAVLGDRHGASERHERAV